VKSLSLILSTVLLAVAPLHAAEKPEKPAKVPKPPVAKATPREPEKQRFALYGMLIDNIPVDLADGAQWMMDKGDTFPVVMFKEGQTKAILQLAGTTFVVETRHLRIIEQKNLTAGELASYRRNVQTYIDTRADQWKARAEKKMP
jgi:hypothetical protein